MVVLSNEKAHGFRVGNRLKLDLRSLIERAFKWDQGLRQISTFLRVDLFSRGPATRGEFRCGHRQLFDFIEVQVLASPSCAFAL